MENKCNENNVALEAIDEAVKMVGSQTKLAKEMNDRFNTNIRQSNIANWITRDKKAPARYVLNIEEITGVSRHKLRADVFGPLPSKTLATMISIKSVEALISDIHANSFEGNSTITDDWFIEKLESIISSHK